MKKIILVAFLAAFATAASAKTVTCRGEVMTGTLDSAVGNCGFLSKSGVAAKIFKVCKMLDECEVKAIVEGDDDWIKRLLSVKLIKRAP